jgi:hypothetical protein
MCFVWDFHGREAMMQVGWCFLMRKWRRPVSTTYGYLGHSAGHHCATPWHSVHVRLWILFRTEVCWGITPCVTTQKSAGLNLLAAESWNNIEFWCSNIWISRWRSWLKHCATSRKVAGSIPDGVIVIFQLHNPSGRTVALGSTQPLTEMSTRNISWGVKEAGA